VNYGIVKRVLGIILIFEALFMVPSLIIATYLNQVDKYPFLICIGITGILGVIMAYPKVKNRTIRAKEGLAIVALSWIFISFFGALPFVFSGSIPSFVDALFETVSGFTTTGATLIDNVEILPKGILFWRSFTHWIGGMGILVFMVALLPAIGVGGFQIFKAESPGPTADRFVPRIKDTAKILYITYISMTILQIVLLLFGGMSFYESMLHTFGTVGTGGFSTRGLSIGAYESSYIHNVISVFMVLSGVNFSLYYVLYKGKWKEVLKNQELKLYLGIIFTATILIAINLKLTTFQTMGVALKDALFQVSSIITTTGYATVDFDLWPAFSKSILFLLMFVGGCAGSTGGGITSIRILVLLKKIRREIGKLFHPRAVMPIKNGDMIISEETVSSISTFFSLYIFIFLISTVIISLEGIDLASAATSVAVTLGNVGPGFGAVGPRSTFSFFTPYSKLFFSFLMLLGRLELFTIIAFLAPKTWRNEI